MSKKGKDDDARKDTKPGASCKLDEDSMKEWLGIRDKVACLSTDVNRAIHEIGKFVRLMNRKMNARYKGNYGLTDNGVLVPQYIMNVIVTMEQKKNATEEDQTAYEAYIGWVENEKFKNNKIAEEDLKKYQELVDAQADANDALQDAMLDKSDFLNELVTRLNYRDSFPVTVDRNGCLVHDAETVKRQEVQLDLMKRRTEE